MYELFVYQLIAFKSTT